MKSIAIVLLFAVAAFGNIECDTSLDCFQFECATSCDWMSCTGTCSDNICVDPICLPDCVYTQDVWLAHVHEVANYASIPFLPVYFWYYEGGDVDVTTEEQLVAMISGNDRTTPIHTLASELTVAWLNMMKGAPTSDAMEYAVIVAMYTVGSCYDYTPDQWNGMLNGTVICGEGIGIVDIATAMIELGAFNEGLRNSPLCPLATFPIGN